MMATPELPKSGSMSPTFSGLPNNSGSMSPSATSSPRSSGSTSPSSTGSPRRSGSNGSWAVDNAEPPIRVKPRRPYTPYNLFYLLERELVVQGNEPAAAEEKKTKRAKMLRERSSQIGKRPEDDIPVPLRYKGVVLLPLWYEPNLKEKRKHRKTHGKISFKELTGIISANWASIDSETKDYCTRISEIGRKRYKETMARYNASQKIIQLKKEHAAMEVATKEKQRMELLQRKDCESPPRPGKAGSNPTTPDRIMSQQAPVVTPTSTYNRSVPMHIPNMSAQAAFYHYGPPPPLPPPMPSRSSPSRPQAAQRQCSNSMQMYNQQSDQHQHQHQHNNHHHQQQHTQHQHTQQQHHQHQHQHPQYQHQQYQQHYHQQQYQQNYHHRQFSYPQAPATNKMNNLEQGQDMKSKTSGKQSVTTKSFSSFPDGGTNVTVAVNVSVKKEDTACNTQQSIHRPRRASLSEKTSGGMSHDEALRLCTLMGSPPAATKQTLPDTLLREMPSFDFADHHSLSTEDGDLSRDMAVDGILDHVDSQEDNILDLIGINLGEEDGFPDF